MKTVKADSKGRVTGLEAGETYVKDTDPDGTVRYKPQTPRTYDHVRDVTPSEFERFFGFPLEQVSVEGFQAVALLPRDKGIGPQGITFQVFAQDSDGSSIYDYASGKRVTTRHLIRLKIEE